MVSSSLRDLAWVESSYDDLMEFPVEVRRIFGYNLSVVQDGGESTISKPLSGFGSAKVRELSENDASGTFRVVYTVEYADIVYVLHVFQKKSKNGIKTPQKDMDTINRRLRNLRREIEESKKDQKGPKNK